MIIIPGRPGLADESKLPAGGMLGRHSWKGCNNGVFYFHEALGGWAVVCNGCGMYLEVPESVLTYGELREFFGKDLAK
jgi:hypothetical protein